MKNIKLILLAFLSFTLVTSCDKDFEELNTDPDNPVAVPAHLLLGYAQRTYTNTIYGMQRGGDMGGAWAQHWSKVQYNNEARYVPRTGVIDAIWSEIYTLTISEAKAMYELAGEEGNTNLQAVALTMQAIGYQTLTDLYGPIPFTEAIDANILQPKYDSETVVYEGVISMLSSAANLFSNGSGSIPATSDLFYGGDVAKWAKFANSLKFRALMRISSTRSVGSELQALINGGNMMTSNSDNAELAYLASQPDANPIYEMIDFGGRPEYKMCSTLVEIMEVRNDGRLDVYAAPNETNGVILGKPAGFGAATTLPNEALGYTYANISGLGDFYLNPELPGVIMSYAQLSLLKAEAANELYISGGIPAAYEYYTDGISASFAWNGLDATSYIAQPTLDFTTQSDARTKIATQEWIALYGQGFESWTEWRRTQLPVLIPAAEAPFNQVPSRLYYPTDEPSLNASNYNSAAQSIGGDSLTSPLFWQ